MAVLRPICGAFRVDCCIVFTCRTDMNHESVFFFALLSANVFSHNKHRLFIVVQLRVAFCQNVINVNGLSAAADKA